MKAQSRANRPFGVLDQLLEAGLDITIRPEGLAGPTPGGDAPFPGHRYLLDLGPVGVCQRHIPPIAHRMDEPRLGEEPGELGQLVDVGLSLVPISALALGRGVEAVQSAHRLGKVLHLGIIQGELDRALVEAPLEEPLLLFEILVEQFGMQRPDSLVAGAFRGPAW